MLLTLYLHVQHVFKEKLFKNQPSYILIIFVIHRVHATQTRVIDNFFPAAA